MDPRLWNPNLCSICIETIEPGEHYRDMWGQLWDSHIRCQDDDLRKAFLRFSREWKQETAMLSSLNDIVTNSNYEHIVCMGWPIVPYLIGDLILNGPDHWYFALSEITGIDAAHGEDTMRGAAQRWIDWWGNLHYVVTEHDYTVHCRCGYANDGKTMEDLRQHILAENWLPEMTK